MGDSIYLWVEYQVKPELQVFLILSLGLWTNLKFCNKR